jgi:transketolase
MRKYIIESVYNAASGHPGGSLSCADILALLYFNVMNVKPEDPTWEGRDRFVLSKGHCAPALYAALALKGFFPTEDLYTLRKIDSHLEGHPNMNTVRGVDMSTGSLGQGISAAVGMALAAKIDSKDYTVYSILGDGEIQEGQVWEALMCAAHYKLDNMVVFLDYNGLQIDGKVTDVLSPEPVVDKFKAFGWNTLVSDGHNYEELYLNIEKAKKTKGMPSIIVCKTVKGKGVSYMENEAGWHGNAPSTELKDKAVAELDARLKELEGK